MTKNAKDRKCYKRANRIMKERVKERKNRMWEVKYKEVDSMVGIDRSIVFSKEFAE